MQERPAARPFSCGNLIPWPSGSGGEGGIRTHGRVSPTHAFQACSLNRSDTSPICAELFSPFSRGPEPVQSSRKLFHAVEEAEHYTRLRAAYWVAVRRETSLLDWRLPLR